MLTDVQIRKAKPAEKAYRLTDSGGLHLFVTPAGGKLWRLRYEIAGKEKTLSIGPYPDISLVEAREAREAAKAHLRNGVDPVTAQRRAASLRARERENTFESIAREWYGQNKGSWAKRHADEVIASFERDVFPSIGGDPIREIAAPDVLEVLRKIEQRPAIETARRIRQRMSAVFVHAIASGQAENDPAAIVKKAMAPHKKGRQPAVVDLKKARLVLRKVDQTPAHPVTKLALRLLALTAVRPGTLTATPWSELDQIDPKRPVWHIPAKRMKLRQVHKDDAARDFLLPLSRQAVEAIDVLRQLTGNGPYVFPNTRHMHRPMSENAMGYLLNRAGFHHQHVPHGWRSTFSTVMNEAFQGDRAIIDLMLAHVSKDKVEGAYNRAAYLDRRTELAQEWADLLMVDQMAPGELLAMPRKILRDE